MKGIKQWLLLPLVLLGISSFNTFASTTGQASSLKQNSNVSEVTDEKGVKRADPQTLEEHFNVFSKEFDNEIKRRNERLSGIEEYLILEKMPTWSSSNEPSNFYYLSENERDELKDYGLDLLKKTARETINKTWWMNDLEDFGKSLISYGVSVKGEDAGKKVYASPELNEEERLERRELREETTQLQGTLNELGKSYEFDSGIRIRGIRSNLQDSTGRVEYYCSLKNFKLFNNSIDKINFRIRGDKEAKVELTKIIWQGLYSRLRLDSEEITEGLDRVTFSLIKDDSLLGSKWGVYLGYDLRNTETIAGMSYVHLF